MSDNRSDDIPCVYQYRTARYAYSYAHKCEYSERKFIGKDLRKFQSLIQYYQQIFILNTNYPALFNLSNFNNLKIINFTRLNRVLARVCFVLISLRFLDR